MEKKKKLLEEKLATEFSSKDVENVLGVAKQEETPTKEGSDKEKYKRRSDSTKEKDKSREKDKRKSPARTSRSDRDRRDGEF